MPDKFDNSQCAISYRLLKLLQWLAENEPEAIKKLIAKAVQQGLDTDATPASSKEDHLENELQESIVDFFSLMEALLSEVLHEDELKQTMQRQLIPALDHIDGSICDTATVASSIAKATSNFDNNSENIKQILFKELLKRWKPSKKPYAH